MIKWIKGLFRKEEKKYIEPEKDWYDIWCDNIIANKLNKYEDGMYLKVEK